jgi:uncharacterized membrane protein YqjE
MTALAPDPTKPLQPDRSLGDLFSELSTDFTGLINAHLELAKVELREEAKNAGRAAGMFTGAAVAGIFALLLLSFAAAWGLAEVIPTGFAFLIVGLVYAVVAAVLALVGKNRAAQIGKPEETVTELKEDVEWARQRRS